MGIIQNGIKALIGEDSHVHFVKEYHIYKNDIIEKFKIPGDVTFMSYDYRSGILTIKAK